MPRNARLDEIKLINGSLDITGVSGEVNASCINGRLEAHNLAGRARLSTINGRLDAKFDQLAGQVMELNSVNGSVDLTIPSDSNAEVEASTVSGNINNDFGLHVNNHRFVGHDLQRRIGQRRHAHQAVERKWQDRSPPRPGWRRDEPGQGSEPARQG